MSDISALAKVEVPDLAELKRRAAALIPMLREHAMQTEEDGRIPAVILDALKENGLLRLTAPRRFNGYELPFRAVAEIVMTLAQGCGSTAWVAGYANTAKWTSALWSAQAQEDIFSIGPDFIMAGSGHRPTLEVTRVKGGYAFSGTWNSLSCVPYASWVGVWLKLPDEGEMPGKVVEAIVPASDVEIVNTWNVAGMKGTGSESIIARDVFVPYHRVMDVSVFEDNDFHRYPTPFKEEALYRAAVHPILALAICIVPAGLAAGALEQTIASADKPLLGTRYSEARESVSFQNQLSLAAMHVDTARLFLFQAASDIDGHASRGENMPLVDRARVRAQCGWIVSHACQAIDLLMTGVGSKAFSKTHPLQLAWRDANTSARHGAVNDMLNRELYGKALLGVDETMNLLRI